MFIYIIIFITLTLLYLVVSSIKLRLKFCESTKFVDLSYTIIRLRLLFDDMTGRIYLFGFGIKKINIIEEIFAEKPEKLKKIKEKKPDEKKKKPSKRLEGQLKTP